MEFEQIRYEVRDRVATMMLHRPDKLNAWTPHMCAEQVEALRLANDDPDVGAIVLTGEGRGFCAGADLTQTVVDPDNRPRATGDTFGLPPGVDWPALLAASKPIVAAVNGVAVGVGVTMWLGADYVVASTAARFGFAFVKIGIVPELGATRLLPDRVGPGHANRLMLSGDLIDAADAARIGLVDELAEPDDLLARATAVAASFAANPTGTVLITKRLLAQNRSEPDLAKVQEREQVQLERCATSDEHKEALRAFRARGKG